MESGERLAPFSVHPRPRGEHAAVSEFMANVVGSSPPARGTPDLQPHLDFRLRFIPARAGNTASPSEA